MTKNIINVHYQMFHCYSAFCGGAWGATGYGILRSDVDKISQPLSFQIKLFMDMIGQLSPFLTPCLMKPCKSNLICASSTTSLSVILKHM